MTGTEALAQTLVNHCVPSAADLDGFVADMAQRLALGGPNALAATKRLLNEIDGSNDLELLRRAAKLSADVLATPDAQARLRAKMAK